MINVGLAERNQLTGEPRRLTRATLFKLFAIIALVSFLLRIFYAGHLYEDDGLWFATAEEVLRGKALYREIYFDKPPGLPLVYALLFSLFGTHILVIRLFTILYALAVSAVLYLFGTRLYNQRAGVLAAAMFAVFSTTHSLGHVQSLNTDSLMALPYTAGAFLLVCSRSGGPLNRTLLALAGGALSGIAFQINPKGAFDLVFFAAWLIALVLWESGVRKHQPDQAASPGILSVVRMFTIATAGFALGSAPFLAYIAVSGSMSEYWRYVWDWGARYSRYYPAGAVASSAVRFTTGYFALNDILFITLVFVAVKTLSQSRARWLARRSAPGEPSRIPNGEVKNDSFFKSDATLLIWFVVSFAGVALGGRFYSHYFFQILPSLCLIGASGLMQILSSLRTRSRILRRVVTTALMIGFVFTLVRFHGRSFLLAVDWAGSTNNLKIGWYHEIRNREEREVAAVVRDLPGGQDSAQDLSLEAIRSGGPRGREPEGAGDFLYVWGYRPEIYFWSGLLPASRYLSAQPLTGVPADVHYFANDYRSILDEATTERERAQLIRDLQQTRPKYIVDELGMFNADLSINSYEELREFMKDYKATGPVARFMIYCRRDLLKKRLRRMSERQ